MKVMIAEDERIAAERLEILLKEYDPQIEIAGSFESIEECVNYLQNHAYPDLLILDISLADGHSFEILRILNYPGPVIFATAYDNFALDAFKMFSIDYILKPVTQQALATALTKYKAIAGTFSRVDINGLFQAMVPRNLKTRFLGKVGNRMFFIETENISFFEADNKIVYMVDKQGNRYMVDNTMEKLEELLDPQLFFRPNRTYIISARSIDQVKPYHNHRLRVFLQGTSSQTEIIISRERVSDFKIWAEQSP